MGKYRTGVKIHYGDATINMRVIIEVEVGLAMRGVANKGVNSNTSQEKDRARTRRRREDTKIE